MKLFRCAAAAAMCMVLLPFSGMAADLPAGYRIDVQGEDDSAVAFWKANDFWGEIDTSKPLMVPRALVVVISQSWAEDAERTPVNEKKELFYRALLPLILVANEEILRDRARLQEVAARQAAGSTPANDDMAFLRNLARNYRVVRDGADDADVLSATSELLARVDAVPPALALGQGAYESGYGTSRFAMFGNALFGQWTFDGSGMRPKEKRAAKGNYGVASFDWPLDSVRAYMRNLNTHRSYADLRAERAALRRVGEPVMGKALTKTLTKYSERGQAYVDTLQSIIRINGLDVADTARLKDEPVTLIVYADSAADADAACEEIKQLHQSGELAEMIGGMGLRN